MRLGLVGTRGLVGSILLQRMQEEGDFTGLTLTFFSTSLENQENAYNLEALAKMDILLSCQGSNYTEKIYRPLRQQGWQGYFIDAASYLRLWDEAVICLDPVNGSLIEAALDQGIKTFVGGNCTVSLMLMALSQVLRSGEVEYLTATTYQAASGAGMQGMNALLDQMAQYPKMQYDPVLGGVLATNLLPWIDEDEGTGIAKEEAKMLPEVTKILGLVMPIPMDSLCVRVPTLRCHAQALMIKLKSDWTLTQLTELIASSNPWVQVIPNNKVDSLRFLTPAAVLGTLTIAVGRIRRLAIPGNYWSLFTVGDQLLWGAAEPLRRMVLLLKKRLYS